MTKTEEAAQLTWRADRLRGQADYLDREAARLLREDAHSAEPDPTDG